MFSERSFTLFLSDYLLSGRFGMRQALIAELAHPHLIDRLVGVSPSRRRLPGWSFLVRVPQIQPRPSGSNVFHNFAGISRIMLRVCAPTSECRARSEETKV